MYALRVLGDHAKRLAPSIRAMSTQSPLVDVSIDNEGIATMTLQRRPVNSLNLDLLKEMSKSLDNIAENKCKAMILTSASPTVFSAGLDITEMYKPDLKRAAEFWSTLQDVWLKLFGSSFISAAAINGHAPAGGCLLAMSCEYRAMVSGKYTIGFNETKLDMIVSTWFMNTMSHTISMRQTEVAITTGKLFTADEALKVGLIDDVALDKADAVAKCKDFINKFDRIPSLARTMTKHGIRAAILQQLVENREADIDVFISSISNPKMQNSLEMYMQALKNKQSQ